MRRFFSTATAVALLLPGIVSAAMGIQVMIDGRLVTFHDVPQSAWFAKYVREAAEAGIVNGYKDARGRLTGRFGPSNSITVAEALKIAVEGASYDDQLYGALIESGVAWHWASAYVSVAKAEDFELWKTRVRLDLPATRAQVASLFTSAFRINVTDVSPVDTRYVDVDTSTNFAASIETLSRDTVVSGDTDAEGHAVGRFRPFDPINRAEVVKMVIEARARYGVPGRGKSPSQRADIETISYTSVAGFEPQVLRIKRGTKVVFRNDSSEPLWVASNPHPEHTTYPALDAGRSLSQGETYIFAFTRIGSFGYHNHMRPSVTGTIIVEE